MSNPATVAEIEKQFPKASAEFVLGCVKKEMPIAEVAVAAAEDAEARIESLTAENESLQSKLTAMEDEKAKAMEDDDAEAKAKAEAEAKAKGADPVAKATGKPEVSAKSKWDSALATELETSKNRQRAIVACNRKNPGLREAMLAEVNG